MIFISAASKFEIFFSTSPLVVSVQPRDKQDFYFFLQVVAPWIKKFYYDGTDTFVVPLGGGFVTLGTCKQYESWNPEVSHHDTASIKERCANLVPSTATAKVNSIWVGLRPHRHILRLEIEKLSNLKVS